MDAIDARLEQLIKDLFYPADGTDMGESLSGRAKCICATMTNFLMIAQSASASSNGKIQG